MLLLLLVLSPILVLSQQAVVAGGGHGKGSSGSTDFTIGQIDHITVQGKQVSMTLGVQQPYMSITNRDSAAMLPAAIIFPNPVVQKFTIRIEKGDPATMKFIVYSVDGKAVMKQDLDRKETEVFASGLETAMYFVCLMDKKTNKILQIIKIIKLR